MRYTAVFFLLEKLLVSQPRTISASLPATAPGHLKDKRPHHHPDPKEESPQWPPSLQLRGVVPKAFTVSLNPAFHPLRMVVKGVESESNPVMCDSTASASSRLPRKMQKRQTPPRKRENSRTGLLPQKHKAASDTVSTQICTRMVNTFLALFQPPDIPRHTTG